MAFHIICVHFCLKDTPMSQPFICDNDCDFAVVSKLQEDTLSSTLCVSIQSNVPAMFMTCMNL